MTEEFLFLVVNLRVVVELKDPELVGEFLQCLRIFNVPENSNLIKLGVNYLIGSVKRGKRFRKGGWVNTTNFYTKYHAAYCAIVGLADDKLFQFVKMIGKNSEWDFILND
ncbi:hypothetical protein MHBO_002554 [Bonamia ostreae]|uniref:Uncharacterized protein n=1 Tax=Bonamia ostreae TaxID=126728 RepID=A0ABV2AMQ6_9EUKA